jgi:hypothetical protein
MTPTKELPAQLREYNRWRRGGEGWHPNPSKIGAMIDAAADRFEELERELEVWKHEVKTLREELDAERENAISLFIELHELKQRHYDT